MNTQPIGLIDHRNLRGVILNVIRLVLILPLLIQARLDVGA